jgi:molecular chaperone DnaJ
MADYYELLGVARDSTPDDIKRAFRRLARETHPDANPGDGEAEHRFRQIAQAYEVLSDPQRRAAYDRGDSFDMGDLFSTFGGIDEVLGRFFGGFGFGAAQRGPAQGADIGVATSITLAEAAVGADREVSYRAKVRCSTCEGSGSAPGVDLVTCSRCGGQGSVRVTRQTMLGTTMSIAPCDECFGRGRQVVEPCSECRGTGSIADRVTVTVSIPPGVDDGARMRLTGRGQAGDPGGRPGDLYVQVTVEADPRFSRHGADLVHRVEIGLAEAALGTRVEVPVIADESEEIDIPAGTQPGTVFKLSKRGMPRLQRRGRGDLLIEVIVVVPQRLEGPAEDALRTYAEAMGESPAEARHHRRRSG